MHDFISHKFKILHINSTLQYKKHRTFQTYCNPALHIDGDNVNLLRIEHNLFQIDILAPTNNVDSIIELIIYVDLCLE